MPGSLSPNGSDDADSWATDSGSDSQPDEELPLAPYMFPLPNGKAPLAEVPDEVALVIAECLAPPVLLEPKAGDLDDLVAFSMTCSRLRAVAYPYLYRSLALNLDPNTLLEKLGDLQAQKRSQCEFLLDNPVTRTHIRALWINVAPFKGIADFMRKLDLLLTSVCPHLTLLVFRNYHCTPAGIKAIASARLLEYLVLEDGLFVN